MILSIAVIVMALLCVVYLVYSCTRMQMPLYLEHNLVTITPPLHFVLSSLYCMIMNNQYDQSALYIAAEGGHKDIVKLLLDKGANTEVTNNVSYCICVYTLLLILLTVSQRIWSPVLCFKCMRIRSY